MSAVITFCPAASDTGISPCSRVDGPSGSIADVHQQQLDRKSGSPLPEEPILTPKAQERLKMGSEALTEGRYKDANQIFNGLYEIAPGNPTVKRALGISFLALGKQDEALLYLVIYDSLEPHKIETLTAIALLHLRQGNCTDAIEELKPVIKEHPKEFLPHYIAAQAYLIMHQFVKCVTRSAKIPSPGQRKYKKIGINICGGVSRIGPTSEALSELDRFLREAPGSPVAPSAAKLISRIP